MQINDFPREKIARILFVVNKLRKLGYSDDPYKIAKDYNIDVTFTKLKGLALSFYNKIIGQYQIFINQDMSKESKRILCFHELGHIFCEDIGEANLYNHRLDPVSDFTANAFMLCFIPSISNGLNLQRETPIESVNKYITVSKLHKKELGYFDGQFTIFDFVDINDKFWTDLK
jgi:Zn-dependent peptidase ImmA (M78 family)